MILGYLVVGSVLVVSFGRLGDLFGRVRMYTLGFAIYTVASLLLAIDWMTGDAGAYWLLGMRVVQGIGAAFLIANSAAILTDAFPSNQRGLALGINNIAAIAGQFIGLVLGGLLAPISWRLIFLVSVPFGLFGTAWSYFHLHEIGARQIAAIDWGGNITFAFGLVLVMIGVSYGIEPYGGHPMGWTSPLVDFSLAGGVALLLMFVGIELRAKTPMFRLALFRIRAFTFGVLSSFLAAIARGGLMFMLIIWLQGIWLPQHGYSFSETPLWAGICMLPLSAGFLIAGPLSGYLSDHHGARPYATGGMLVCAGSFVMLELLPVNFNYWMFAAIIFVLGLAMGAFASPNRAGIMNSLPAADRGAGSGMNATFQNSAQVLSIGVFFSLMIIGLSGVLPTELTAGLQAHGVGAAQASQIGNLPPIAILFAAFLGENPVKSLLGNNTVSHLSQANLNTLTGREFFPHLISGPFQSGLRSAFAFAIVACLIAAAASWFRGKRFIHSEDLDLTAIPEA
jgi:MFS family permease